MNEEAKPPFSKTPKQKHAINLMSAFIEVLLEGG